MQTHKVLLYNKPWDMNYEINDQPIIEGFELSTDHRYIDEAQVVIFHMPTLPRENAIFSKNNKKDNQIWVFWSMECEAHYQWQQEQNILSLFDFTATYKLDSDVPVPYIYRNYPELLKTKPTPKAELINAFISSNFNQSRRINYLKELMSYINVHSYGKTLNNKNLPDDKGILTKQEIISSYKFTIAFENAIATDYVTEKFFQPLIAGSVPVYLGAPNIEEFAPGDNCYINVNSFTSVKLLADYILELDNNDEKYEEYLKWKERPLRDSFLSKTALDKGSPLVTLCNLIKSKLQL
jgi:hypothetical protein